MYISTFGGMEASDFRLEDLKVSEFVDGTLGRRIADYCTGDPYFDFYFSDELKKKRDSFVKDEKIKSLKDQDVTIKYESNTAVFKTEDGNEVLKLKIGFSDSGDKIASIEIVE